MSKAQTVLQALIVGASIVAGTLAAEVARAQTQPPGPTNDLPSDDQLDALLAARKWNDLVTVLAHAGGPESIVRAMNWERAKIDSGGGFFLGYDYAVKLWTVGNAMKVEDPGKDLRVMAGLITLYSYELIAIDGAECGDPTAPSHRADQLFMSHSATMAFLKTRPDDLKAKVVDLAIAFERKTAPLRKPDDLLCRNGMEEMKAGLEAGATHEVPNTNGHVGKTVAVEAPPGFEPRFLTPEQYQPAQDQLRQNMRAALLKLVH